MSRNNLLENFNNSETEMKIKGQEEMDKFYGGLFFSFFLGVVRTL